MNTRKVQDFVVRGKEGFVGLEDSKKTWKIAVRCEKMVVRQVSMEAKYLVLAQYLPPYVRSGIQRIQSFS